MTKTLEELRNCKSLEDIATWLNGVDETDAENRHFIMWRSLSKDCQLAALRAAEQRGIEKCGESIQILIDGLPPIVDRLNRESENSSQRRSRAIRSNFILCLNTIRALAQGGE